MTFYWYSGRTRLDLPMQRSSGPCRLAWLLAAALIALLFGVVAPAQALPQPSAHLHHYVYDAAVHDSVLTDTATERGPPVAWDTDQDRTAVGRASNGVLARPAMATVSDNYDHDGSPQFVQAAQGGNTDARPVGALTGQLSSVHPGQVAANTPARFAVNSAGEATMFLRAGSASLEVTEHAARRMTQRGISIDAAETALTRTPFPYFHKGTWKSGYYDSGSRVFMGTVNGRVTTVIDNAKPGYIENLKAALP